MELRRIHTSGFLFALIAGFVAVSCVDLEELPDEPIINEITFDPTDRALYVRFTDGDGDFGLEPDQLAPPFQEENEDGSPNYFHRNFHVDWLYREAGEWLPVPVQAGAGGFGARLPDLTPQGQNKQLRVLITYDLSPEWEVVMSQIPEADTVMFRAVLIDRALNVSEEAESAPVAIN